jgi:hypothetical protein
MTQQSTEGLKMCATLRTRVTEVSKIQTRVLLELISQYV